MNPNSAKLPVSFDKYFLIFLFFLVRFVLAMQTPGLY